MTEWRDLTMADVMAEFYDGPHATPAPAHEGPVYLGIKNITDAGMLDLSDVRHISEEDFEHWTRRVLPQPGDVVFTYEATLHRYALIPEGFRGCLGRRIALIRPNRDVVRDRFLHFTMLGPQWRSTVTDRIISGSTVDRVPLITFPEFPICIPDLATQDAVIDVLGALDDLIENNRRRVELVEEMARAVYREWFIHFRFPGHEEATFVDSALGPIPGGWEVAAVESLGAEEKWAITGGPFGSKLGRKDYVETGVPVLRGANLAVGGGFNESDLVFVTEEKAQELRSCWALRGDVVITQRGTLGQIGLIPDSSRHEVYVLSQSQMKVTLDEAKLSHVVFYEQMRSPEVTERFIARAMTAGVPHLNLGLLREFEVLVPPQAVQTQFGEAVLPMHSTLRSLLDQSERLGVIRQMLLPKVVTGQIDVSDLDLDEIVEKAGV